MTSGPSSSEPRPNASGQAPEADGNVDAMEATFARAPWTTPPRGRRTATGKPWRAVVVAAQPDPDGNLRVETAHGASCTLPLRSIELITIRDTVVEILVDRTRVLLCFDQRRPSWRQDLGELAQALHRGRVTTLRGGAVFRVRVEKALGLAYTIPWPPPTAATPG